MKKGCVVWLTGLPSSGKTTVAGIVEKKLKDEEINVEVFDGDEVRKNLSAGLGFSKEDRLIHNKRVIYVAKLLARNGIVVLISLISPYREVRRFARGELEGFFEVWVKCSVEKCIERDVKGLYKKALSGEIDNMTGIQAPYEEPENPELIICTDQENEQESADKIINKLKEMKYLDNE